eukprot:5652854-Amphidinium_carterae.2
MADCKGRPSPDAPRQVMNQPVSKAVEKDWWKDSDQYGIGCFIIIHFYSVGRSDAALSRWS